MGGACGIVVSLVCYVFVSVSGMHLYVTVLCFCVCLCMMSICIQGSVAYMALLCLCICSPLGIVMHLCVTTVCLCVCVFSGGSPHESPRNLSPNQHVSFAFQAIRKSVFSCVPVFNGVIL